MERPSILFITGKLAEPALRRVLDDLAPRAEFVPHIAVLPITVAALATTPWIARHLTIASDIARVIVPGLCQGDLAPLQSMTRASVERGPADLRELPEYFQTNPAQSDYGAYDIEILAEINHAPRMPRDQLLALARRYRADGADIIDLGCDPGSTWNDVGVAVRGLRGEGLRVSIDSFNPVEVAEACSAGAELVLSVNSSNADAARSWGREVVVLPDDLATLGGLDTTIEKLVAWGVPFRIDPVIEPIGFGFAASLGRYLEVRRRYPGAEMMLGVGNLTELTDVDSAGINVLLLGFCQELGIRSVLTTEVINWCRTSVRELDRARRLVFHALHHRVLPKHLAPELVQLRDPRLHQLGEQGLAELAVNIKDRNYRLFAEAGLIHVLNNAGHLRGDDAFKLFEQLHAREPLEASHAFYLGYEMAKARIALTLGKNYVQDQAPRWGMLTEEERTHERGDEETR